MPHLHVCDQHPLEAKRGNCLHTDRKRTLKRSSNPNQALKRAKAQKPMGKGTLNPRGSPELTATQLAIGRDLPGSLDASTAKHQYVKGRDRKLSDFEFWT